MIKDSKFSTVIVTFYYHYYDIEWSARYLQIFYIFWSNKFIQWGYIPCQQSKVYLQCLQTEKQFCLTKSLLKYTSSN